MTLIESKVSRTFQHWKLFIKYITPSGKTHSVLTLKRTDEVHSRRFAEKELSALVKRARRGELLPTDQEIIPIPRTKREKEAKRPKAPYKNDEGFEFRGRGPRNKRGLRWYAVFRNGKQIKDRNKLLKIQATTPGHASVIFEIEYV